MILFDQVLKLKHPIGDVGLRKKGSHKHSRLIKFVRTVIWEQPSGARCFGERCTNKPVIHVIAPWMCEPAQNWCLPCARQNIQRNLYKPIEQEDLEELRVLLNAPDMYG